jgi:uncharacterized protein (TIGR03435 family)
MTTKQIAWEQNWQRLLFRIATWTLLFVPTAFGQVESHPAPEDKASKLSEFEIISIKPTSPKERTTGIFTYPGGKVIALRYSMKMLLLEAFNIQQFQVSGGPGWINEDLFDVVAIPPASSKSSKLNPSTPKAPLSAEQRQMLLMMLVNRFELKFHDETKEGRVYLLVKGNKDLHLHESENKDEYPWVGGLNRGALNGEGMIGRNVSMSLLATRLSTYLGCPVLDRTGLKGSYDFKFEYSSDKADQDVISLILASMQGIGLNLKTAKGPIETIVVDHVAKPSAN